MSCLRRFSAYVTIYGMAQNDVSITTKQVADLVHVDSSTVRRWVEKGLLVPEIVTPGGHYRFDKNAVLEAMKPTVKEPEAAA